MAGTDRRSAGAVVRASSTELAVGSAVHAALAELAADRSGLSLTRVLQVSGGHARRVASSTRTRVGAQHVAPLAGVGARMFPPSGWQFVGSEVSAGVGRVDLVWSDPDVGVFVDEVKVAGLGRAVEDAAVRAQLARYLEWGTAEFGDRFCGVRLLTLSGPLRSRWYPPVGRWVPLVDTGFWFGFDTVLGGSS